MQRATIPCQGREWQEYFARVARRGECYGLLVVAPPVHSALKNVPPKKISVIYCASQTVMQHIVWPRCTLWRVEVSRKCGHSIRTADEGLVTLLQSTAIVDNRGRSGIVEVFGFRV